MKIKLVLALSLMIAIFGCGETPKTAEQLKEELRQTEVNRPAWHLRIDDESKWETLRKKVKDATFFKSAQYKDDGAVISGVIKSSASIARFKDVKVAISYTSKTNTKLRTDNFVIYEVIEPNGVLKFNIKIDNPPKAVNTFDVKVTGAIPIW